MSKTDIRHYTENELSLIVFNTEELYRLRHFGIALMDVLHERYIFTEEQENVLHEDLRQDNIEQYGE